MHYVCVKTCKQHLLHRNKRNKRARSSKKITSKTTVVTITGTPMTPRTGGFYPTTRSASVSMHNPYDTAMWTTNRKLSYSVDALLGKYSTTGKPNALGSMSAFSDDIPDHNHPRTSDIYERIPDQYIGEHIPMTSPNDVYSSIQKKRAINRDTSNVMNGAGTTQEAAKVLIATFDEIESDDESEGPPVPDNSR